MKNLKALILLFGVLGLVAMLVPFKGGSMLPAMLKADLVQGLLYGAVFILPTVMGAMAMSKPPMQAWQAAVALGGFALGVVKWRVWETLPHIMDGGVQGILLLGSIVGGTIVSIMALVKPEPRA